MTSLPISAVFTDLDGTLLNSARQVSAANLKCLEQLGQSKIVRVIATGRSLYSFQQVIQSDFPADYLIFSSGAGIIDLHSGNILKSAALFERDISTITETLVDLEIDFMVHHTIPENHRFTYRLHDRHNTDFQRRIHLYRDFAENFADTCTFPSTAAQVIAILPDGPDRFQTIKSGLNGFQVTRTTSPLDHASIWMEIYPANVHKGSAAAWLCDRFRLDPQRTVGIGNDYNDLDLLAFTPYAYLLRNAPRELHNRYELSLTNDEDGFAHAVYDAIRQYT